MRDFTKYPKEEISGNQGFRARGASYPCYYTLRGKVLLTLVYFYLKGVNLNGFDLRGCLALFPYSVPCFMAQLGIVLGHFLWLFYSWFVGCFIA